MKKLKVDFIYRGKPLVPTISENPEVELNPEAYIISTNTDDNISMHYSLFLEDGTKVFTPYDTELFRFSKLGYSSPLSEVDRMEDNGSTIIQGLDQAILRLELGDFIRVKIPYQYAYGEAGIPYMIPGKSNLIYYLQVVSIQRNSEVYDYPRIFNLNEIVKEDNIEDIRKKVEEIEELNQF